MKQYLCIITLYIALSYFIFIASTHINYKFYIFNYIISKFGEEVMFKYNITMRFYTNEI